MKTATYPEIGQTVSFIRQNPDRGAENQMLEGDGMIQAVLLDASKRLVAHIVQDGQPAVNVDLRLLNPSEETKAAFVEMVGKVKALENEGNGKVQEIVAEYNGKVEAELNVVLGETLSV